MRLLLIDSHSVFHAIKFSFSNKRLSHDEKYTFVIYGFLLKLKYLINNITPDLCIFAADSKKSRRREIFPEYQQKRIKRKKEKKQSELDKAAYPQFKEILEYVLPTIGFSNIFKADGFEADDIIARICLDNKSAEKVIVTNDKDMYQLLDPKTCIYKHHADVYYTASDFKREYLINPSDWKKVKVFGGCSTDEVPGLPIPNSTKCIGEGFAIKYIRGKLPKNYKAYQAFIDERNKEIILRNRRLTVLPFGGTPHFKLKKREQRLRKGLIKVSRKYNFQSILNNFDVWAKEMKLK